jgi:hypothetical protein
MNNETRFQHLCIAARFRGYYQNNFSEIILVSRVTNEVYFMDNLTDAFVFLLSVDEED